jgi:acetyl-CoA carboxylase carboxyl transferase subunit alpha
MAEQEPGKLAQVQAAATAVPEAWRRTELARHPERPYPMDFIAALFTDFSEIHGDRAFGDDSAMACGMARFHGRPVMVVANLKGRSIKERVARKFGSPDPEGYRKALRAMKIAEKFGHAIFTFLDVAGANPGIGAEERGQGEAIARNLLEMSRLRVPTIATITGEGGSGGALALAVADRVLMLENAIYSVISPEGCASIMWKDATKKQQAADALKSTTCWANPKVARTTIPRWPWRWWTSGCAFIWPSSTPNRWSRCWKSATRSSATSRSSIPPPSERGWETYLRG